MFKDFLIKKMLKAKGASDEQASMMVAMMNKNPELFKQIAAETEVKVKAGIPQEQAAMEVMMAHQAELQELMK